MRHLATTRPQLPVLHENRWFALPSSFRSSRFVLDGSRIVLLLFHCAKAPRRLWWTTVYTTPVVVGMQLPNFSIHPNSTFYMVRVSVYLQKECRRLFTYVSLGIQDTRETLYIIISHLYPLHDKHPLANCKTEERRITDIHTAITCSGLRYHNPPTFGSACSTLPCLPGNHAVSGTTYVHT